MTKRANNGGPDLRSLPTLEPKSAPAEDEHAPVNPRMAETKAPPASEPDAAPEAVPEAVEAHLQETLPAPAAQETIGPADSPGAQPDALSPTRSGRASPPQSRRSERAKPPEEHHGLKPGVVVDGQFELIRELGRGGMGVVYVGRDLQLGRRVAVKFVLLPDKQARKRFLAEARTTARCTHPNIVVVHEADEFNGLPYMVLEYLEGKTLRDLMDEHASQAEGPEGEHRGLSAARTLELMLPVLRALERAHGMGIVHRDLKPENVILTDTGVVKVLDFGIAKSVSPAPGAETSQEPAAAAGRSFEPSSPTLAPKTKAGGLIGTLPYMSPEQLNAEAVDLRVDIWAAGIMLFEMIAGHHPMAPLSMFTFERIADVTVPMPRSGELCPAVGALGPVIDRCLLKDRNDRIGSVAELIADLEPLAPGHRSVALEEGASPFTGLSAFQESDAYRFFGRSEDTLAVASRVREQPLVAVIGPSGAGKSSLVRAGVIPALKRSGEGWQSFIVRPGRAPLLALAEVAARLERAVTTGKRRLQTASDEPADRDATVEQLRAEPGYLGATLRAHAQRKLRRVLLFIDQFEELYTLCADEDERGAFLAGLAGVADDAGSPLRVILSMRADFLERLAENRSFMALATRGLILLPPMGRAGLLAALEKPLAAVGYGFESDATVRDMLDGLEGTRSALPLLQFAATTLWKERDRGRQLLTEDSYQAMGGITGTLAIHADSVVAGMTRSRRKLARAVFERLVTPERTRAVVSVSELREVGGVDGDAVETVLDELVRARLLVVDANAVEIVHESLIDGWPMLQRWLDENAEDAAFVAQLRTAAKEWERKGHAEGMLWAGEVAREARLWHERYQGELAKRETAFLQAVFANAERAVRRRRRLRYGVMAALAVVAASATVGVFVIRQEQRAAEKAAVLAKQSEAEAEKSEAEARKQALMARKAVRVAGAKGLAKREPDTALRLLREVEVADASADTLEWYATVQLSASNSPSFERDWLTGHDSGVNSAVFSANGARVVTASEDKTARVWTLDADTGKWMGYALEGHEGGVRSAEFSLDGKRVVTASADKTARVWTQGEDGGWTGQALEGHEDGVRSAAFSRDGTRVVTASWDKTARVWTQGADATWTGQALVGHAGGVRSAEFSVDGTRVVTTASWDETARVWTQGEDGGWTGQVLEGHEKPVTSAEFSLDGKRVVTASADRTARVWTQSGARSQERWTGQVLEGHEKGVNWAAFSPDGVRVVTASADGTARIWTQGADQRWTGQALEGHAGPVTGAGFSADGTLVVTVSVDKTARVWMQGEEERWSARALEGHGDRIDSARFSADGMRVVTASRDRRARVWVLASEELVPRLWRDLPECLPVEKRRTLLSETPETARLNRDACQACVAYYQDAEARFPCPYRADGDLLATASPGQPESVPRPEKSGLVAKREFVAKAPPTRESGVIVPPTVPIPGGTFQMGSKDTEPNRGKDEGPVHEVTVSTFTMCETEITQAQWASVMVENAEPSGCSYGCSDGHPVQTVSWFDVIEYLNRLSASQGLETCYEHDGGDVRWKSGSCNGYRLPTEAEWEYAARAGTTTAYSFGDDPNELKDYGWYSKNSGNRAHPVGSKERNPWGLADMHGNLWEWTWDWYGRYSPGSQGNPKGQKTGDVRVLRGGSFGSEPRDMRSAVRRRYGPMDGNEDVGFRCARAGPPQHGALAP